MGEREREKAGEEREKRYRTNLANFHINLLDRSDTHTHTHTRAHIHAHAFRTSDITHEDLVRLVPVSHLTLSMALQIPQTKYDRFNIAS